MITGSCRKIIGLGLALVLSALCAQARTSYNFNADWRHFVGDAAGAEKPDFDDTGWKTVSTPHAWNEDDAFRRDIRDLSTGIAWYRKHFKLPADAAGKKIFLEFEGIRQAGEFYLNGRFVGRHENGVSAFGFDVTDFLSKGENVLAVRVDNSWDYKEKATGSAFQWNDRNFYANYGGINKNVYLHVADRLYQTLPLYTNLGTTGVYVYADDFDIKNRTARITAESEIKNEFPTARTFDYEVAVKAPGGRIVKTIKGGSYTIAAGETKTVKAAAVINNLNFWSWGYGYLYTVETTLKIAGKAVDTVATRTGFRKTEFANGMFRLNDRTLQLKGYAQRTTNEWPALGSAVPAWLSDFSNGLMVASNANLVRWMHVTPSKQDVESCDRVGLIEALPAGDSEKDVDGRRWEQRLEAMRDGIIYNRNNPSVIFLESGNKGVSEEHMRQMKALRDRFDPHGGRASGSREMLASKTAEYGGEMLYINKSATKPVWAMEYSRDEGLRKYWDEFSPPYHRDGDGPLYQNQDASVYNRNQDSFAVEDVTRWFDYWEARPGTGKRVSAGGVNIIFSDSNTHHRGAENYRRSGETDALRLAKDGYFAHRVMWDGWVDIERPRTHIVGHWNYAPGTKKNVYVVSGAERVELFLNGRSLGFGERSSRFLFTFKNVEWRPGALRAVGYDRQNRKITEDAKQTAGAPFAVRLTPRVSPAGLRADGADVALVDVEVVDRAGRRCPTALNTINFELSGAAEWRGGIAQGPDNFILSKTLPVENGVNRVILRSTRAAGKITLRATAEGLKPAVVGLASRPFAAENGIARELPADRLPIVLERGPTPAGESFRPTRTTLDIAGATAGSNADKARHSFDDDETTDWTSDGRPETAWIEYDLGRPAAVSQVVLKLVGWRTQSYPLKISVDGRAVFAGNSPRSLGYATFGFPATAGRRIRIELTASATNRDAFGNIVEIPGTPDAQSAAGKGGARSTLGIVEAEIYESLGS
ncbi:MAG: DUF4982 domain-containing protein [Acidobacteria bacterium]|nr:DUF4982 domain-containing protein [Acidobacteriota bacterium]